MSRWESTSQRQTGHHLSTPVLQSFLRRLFPLLALRSGQYHTRKQSAASSCAPIASPPLICTSATNCSAASYLSFIVIRAPQ